MSWMSLNRKGTQGFDLGDSDYGWDSSFSRWQGKATISSALKVTIDTGPDQLRYSILLIAEAVHPPPALRL